MTNDSLHPNDCPRHWDDTLPCTCVAARLYQLERLLELVKQHREANRRGLLGHTTYKLEAEIDLVLEELA